jgi:hypothetical protein
MRLKIKEVKKIFATERKIKGCIKADMGQTPTQMLIVV